MTKEHTPKTEKLITQWLTLRQELLQHYWQLTQLPPYSDDLVTGDLERFCELLIDYTSMGHFSVFEKLLPERSSGKTREASIYFENISKSTDAILDFNDAYDQDKKFLLKDEAGKQISILGEALAHRLESEDGLLNIYKEKTIH